MQGFVGFSTFDKSTLDFKQTLENMISSLQNNEKQKINFTNDFVALSKITNKYTPICYNINNTIYTIILNGTIYNIKELKNDINDFFDIEENTDEEILLKCFIHFGTNITQKINGIFSLVIWNDTKKELFLARDHFGIKPLYYGFINNTLAFSTKISSLFKIPFINPEVTKQGICELFGIGPAHTPRGNSF